MPAPKGYISPEVRTKMAAVAAFVEKYRKQHGYSPSYRELADHFGVSTSLIRFYVDHMVKQGQATTTYGIARSLVISETPR